LSTQQDQVDWKNTIGLPQATMSQFADLRKLQGTEPAVVRVTARTRPSAGERGADTETDVTITNTSSKPVAFFLRADVRRGSSSGSSRMIPPPSVVAWMMLVGLLITVPAAAVSGVPAHLGPGSGAWLAVSGAGNVMGLVLTYSALRIGQVALVAPLVSTEGAV